MWKDNFDNIKCTDAVVKIASRCNINCTYCYMYNSGDESYKFQPKFMNDETVISLFKKVKTHCLKKGLSTFHFILHGGEPLLVGESFFRDFVKKAKRILLPEIKPTFSIQTNGILINDKWCELFKELKIGIGISIDGIQSVNDENRIDHRGKGTYERVVKGIKTMQRNDVGIGVLSVVNVDSDPIEAYEHIKLLNITSVDFLLPDYTYDNPPKGIINGDLDRLNTPYADWLIKIFDKWFTDKDKLDIRLFKYAVCLLLGGEIEFDYIGTANNDVLVIETDGGIEPVDSLKICGNEFTKIKANIKTHQIDEALQSPLSRMYHLSKKMVSKRCSVCPILEICGGGFLPHRYSSNNGFNNPSIYCVDLIKLFTHMQGKVMNEFTKAQLEEFGGITILTHEDVKKSIRQEVQEAEEPGYSEFLEFFKTPELC